jgi:hypothetical protein
MLLAAHQFVSTSCASLTNRPIQGLPLHRTSSSILSDAVWRTAEYDMHVQISAKGLWKVYDDPRLTPAIMDKHDPMGYMPDSMKI